MAHSDVTAASGAPVLEITDLTIDAPDGRRLVDGLSLSVSAGEVVALVGESGSGKSLTGKAILGLLPPGLAQSGSVVLAGHQIVGLKDEQVRPLRGTTAAMVFQEPQSALNPSQRIGKQLYEVLAAHRPITKEQARKRAIELLESVEIPHAAERVDWYPHQLSGGQRQRVVIALALAGEPKLLIADEPTTALDVTVQASILDLFRSLQKSHDLGILLITHNMGVVADIADRVVVIQAGEFIESAPVDTLFAHPTQDYTRALLAAVPRLQFDQKDVRRSDAQIVTVEHLTVTYPGRGRSPAFTALHDIDFTVDRGAVVGVVGESGSGKTTLGRAILGLTPVSSGSIDVRTDKIALIHQDPYASLDPRWPVWRSITEPLAIHGDLDKTGAKRRALELLDAVRLPRTYVDSRPGALSGGQRQRVALARALAGEPELLIADEPTSALDVSVQASVLELFTQLQAELGFAVVFITHDLAVVSQLADTVAIFRSGRLEESGPTGALFAQPLTEYTRNLVAAVPVPDPQEQRRRNRKARA
ncbi:MAG: ABC transporter ATP-binding protein [Gordonia sp. (in: high G+C Gram-positive bacteria)]